MSVGSGTDTANLSKRDTQRVFSVFVYETSTTNNNVIISYKDVLLSSPTNS
jgi:hypothetical protein